MRKDGGPATTASFIVLVMEQRRRPSRREFLKMAPVIGVAGWTGCGMGLSYGGIIDTHTHFYDPKRPGGVPWPPADDPVLYRTVLPEEYRRLSQPLGVRGTIVVEASSWVGDNQWVLDLIDGNPFLIGLIGNLPIGTDDFGPAWERYRRNRRFRGIRIHGLELAAAIRPSRTQDHLQEVGRAGLAVDVLVGIEQLGQVATLADQLRNLRLVVDHCANVPMGRAPHPGAWVSGLAACHYAPNVSMKVSGLVEGTGKTQGDAPRETLVYRPVVENLWHVLGEDRLIYGSNWPVSSRYAPYETVQGIVTDIFNGFGGTAATKYFRRNAERVYGVRVDG